MRVPDGWIEEIFGSVSEFKNGLNFTKSDHGESIKIVGVGDFKGFSELKDTDNLEYVRVANKIRDEELLKSGDLLFVRSNGNKDLIGRCLYFPVVTERLSYSGFTIRGRIDSRKILPEYASYLVRSSFVKRQFLQNGGGTNISNLSQQILNDVIFGLPPFPEQQKIAQILSTWGKAIRKLEALIASKQKRKEALLQQLLTGKKRFSGFNEEWETYRLGDLFDERNETGFHDMNLLSITRGKGVIPRNEVERKDTSNDDKSKYLRICPGDIGYNTMRMWQGVSALSMFEGIVSPAYTICIPRKKIDGKFAAYLFKTMPIIHLFQRYSQGLTSDTWNLKFHHFSEIKINIPTEIAEQQKIASVLSAAEKEIETHQNQLSTLKEQKKGLMQQLLTGKRRVQLEKRAENVSI